MEIENIGSYSSEGSSGAQAAYGCFNYHFLFTPNALFSWGLAVSYNLVEYACVSLLVTFYTNRSESEKHVAEAAVLVCLQEGLASMAAILLARITHQRPASRYYAIVISAASYITGILLLWLYGQHKPTQAMNVPFFSVVSVLFAVGKGGANPLLDSFLAHNLSESNYKGTSQSKEICRNVWMHSAWILGATIAIFGFLGVKWLQVFKVSAIVMVASALFFLFGCNIIKSGPIAGTVDTDGIQISQTPQLGEKSYGAKPPTYLKWLLILSCSGYSLVLSTAWRVEVQRKKVATDTMSVLWMCPHYVLLGLVEGLSQSGLEKLLEDDENVKNLRNGKFSKDMVSCIGRFLGIPCILIVKKLFKNFDKDQSHFDSALMEARDDERTHEALLQQPPPPPKHPPHHTTQHKRQHIQSRRANPHPAFRIRVAYLLTEETRGCLVLVRSIVEHMTVCMLMIYLLIMMRQDLFRAAITLNISDGISSLLAFLVAYVAHAYTDYFNVIVFSSACYVMGLSILYGVHCYTYLAPTVNGLTNVGILLIALGKSGGGSTLRSFLQYEVTQGRSRKRRRFDHGREIELVHVSNIWWHSARVYGYLIVPIIAFVLGSAEGEDTFSQFHVFYYSLEISVMLMVFSSLTFFYANRFYHYNNQTDQNVETTSSSSLITHVLKAASSNNLLMWASFIPYGAVLATANTLFIAQITNMSLKYTRDFMFVAPPLFFALKSLTCDLVNFLLWYLMRRSKSYHSSKRNLTNAIRIGSGLIFSVIACVAARAVELKRLKKIEEEGLIDEAIKMSSMSGLWLIPEFVALRLMEGLVGGGIVTHLKSHVPELSMRGYAQPLSELVVCVGKFCSILFMSSCNLWFGQSINYSKVDSDGSACENGEINDDGSNQAGMGNNVNGEIEEDIRNTNIVQES
ncbi:protein NRT1/ PTR FAMILY 5.14-like [Senna tora]|uniref:Protein NRT1/ PTR FAMILY 5.14-like n=1 Tax=Senna tora TaxID=362788 RepID=A0A834XJ14_9FABA|nr:protein NRT1/ PTR FAMILY 5.14-like [Senna tora]